MDYINSTINRQNYSYRFIQLLKNIKTLSYKLYILMKTSISDILIKTSCNII